MTRSSYPLKLSHSVKAAAQRLAEADGVSLNQFIAAAVAEKIGTLQTIDHFLKTKAGDALPQDMLPFLDNAPDQDPVAGDESIP